jgi:hypothetical protein
MTKGGGKPLPFFIPYYMIEKSDLFFCKYCDAELLNERVSNVAEDQNITEEEARELIEEVGEVGMCRDCHKEQDSDY